MTAILFRLGSKWIMEIRLSGSFHANCKHTFSTAKEARLFAKRYGISVRRASGCDSLGDD
jgi:hypothetical protein